MFIDFFIYLFVSFIILIFISKISYKLDLVDMPSERKMHLKPTAYTGGMALGLIYIFSIYFFEINYEKLNLILSIAFLISIVGFIDDRYNLNVGGKLSLQTIPIIYLIVIESFTLNQIGDYNYFQLKLNTFSIPFTILSVIFLINSANYFDGLDGVLSATTLSVLGILYFIVPDDNVRLFITSVIIPILIFMCFNFSVFNLPKVFLGDSGSLLIGFILSFTLIFIANEILIHPIVLAWSISIFVYEFLTINFIRLLRKKNLFQSGTDHLHHILYRKISSVIYVNFIISTVNINCFIIGYIAFVYVSSLASLILFIILFLIFFIIRLKFINEYN